MQRMHWTWEEEEKQKGTAVDLRILYEVEGTWTCNRVSKVSTGWLFSQLKCEQPGWKLSIPCGGLEFGQIIKWDTLLRPSQKRSRKRSGVGGGWRLKPRRSVLDVRVQVSVSRQIFWLGPATGDVCMSLAYSSELWQPTVMGGSPFGHLSFLW